MIFQNVFYDGSNYIVFDQEWFERNIPLEFLIYRSIKQLYFQYPNIENIIQKNLILEKFNLSRFVNIFDKIEEMWQKDIMDLNMYNFYQDKWRRINSLEDIKFSYNQEIGKLHAEKSSLERKIIELQIENNDKIKDLEKKIFDLYSENTKIQKEYSEIQKEYNEKIKNLEENFNQLEIENNEKKLELEQIKSIRLYKIYCFFKKGFKNGK